MGTTLIWRMLVSVLDRGFIFGEGIYEVIGVHSRKPFALSLHLEGLTLICQKWDYQIRSHLRLGQA